MDDPSFNKLPPHRRLEEQIDLEHLKALRDMFEEHNPAAYQVESESKYAPTKYVQREAGSLSPEEFKATIAGVLGTDKYNKQLDKLFTKLDTSCDGYVDWNEFATYMLLHYRESEYLSAKKEIPFKMEAVIRHILPNKQEITTRILATGAPTKYVTISKDGMICVWSLTMTLEKHARMEQETSKNPNGSKPRCKTWITDAAYLPDCNKIVAASTRRDLRFYDITGTQIVEDYHFYGLNYIPQCLHYHWNSKEKGSPSALYWGDDAGNVNKLIFKMPRIQLFEQQFNKKNKKSTVYMQDIARQDKYVEFHQLKGIHDDAIRQVELIPDLSLLITSSISPKASLKITDLKKYKSPYIFKLQKGAECFAYSRKLDILATGSADHFVRIWNPYVPSKPTALLKGHYMGVIGITIQEDLQQVFSYSKDAMVKVWDIQDQTCLQTVVVKFPSIVANASLPENGSFPLLLHMTATRRNLLLTSNDFFGVLTLDEFEKSPNESPTSHMAPLVGALFNPFFSEVATAAEDSSIICWDVDTGSKNIVFSNAHGDEAISCLTFDGNWRRLLTGARNGTIKVWNFQNGHNLNKLDAVDDSEVTGLASLTDHKRILSVGWSRKIIKYDDSHPDNMYIEPDDTWKSGMAHTNDILTMAVCLPNYLATGSFNGEIAVWLLETESIHVKLRPQNYYKDRAASVSSFSSRSSSGSRRSAARQRQPVGEQVMNSVSLPVDKLLFLPSRMSVSGSKGASLVSSEAGRIRWWNIFSDSPAAGQFYAPHTDDQYVLGLGTSKACDILITGDTAGFISTWSISDYCTKYNSDRIEYKPVELKTWRAHDGCIVSTEIVESTKGTFVLSASTDHTARLWTIKGEFIGTFGQLNSWDVSNKETWASPYNPWSVEYLEKHRKYPRRQNSTGEDKKNASGNSGNQGATVRLNVPEDSSELAHKQLIKQRPIGLLKQRPTEELMDGYSKKTFGLSGMPKSLTVMLSQEKGGEATSPRRSESFHNGETSTDSAEMKSIIGEKAIDELVQIRVNRRKRREDYGTVNMTVTERFGSSCCPFQALSTKDLLAGSLVNRPLPVTERMVRQGYDSESLMNEQKLQSMNLSYTYNAPEKQQRKTKAGTHPK